MCGKVSAWNNRCVVAHTAPLKYGSVYDYHMLFLDPKSIQLPVIDYWIYKSDNFSVCVHILQLFLKNLTKQCLSHVQLSNGDIFPNSYVSFVAVLLQWKIYFFSICVSTFQAKEQSLKHEAAFIRLIKSIRMLRSSYYPLEVIGWQPLAE